MPDRFDLALYRGDSYIWSFTLWTDEAKTLPADLTDVTVKSEIRNKPSGDTIIEMDCTVDDPLTGLIEVLLTAENCTLVPAAGVWDLQLTYLDGTVKTIVAGNVRNTPDVTDST